jgi:CHASE2 domain-containing sensor protein
MVIIGDLRSGVDRHHFGHPTGQPGCYAHAVLIEQLLQELAFPGHRPAPLAFSASATIAMCAVAGVVIGFCSFRRRAVLTAASILAICAISGLAAQQAKVLLNPIAPILTLTIACFATALLKLGPAWAASRRPV